MPINEPSRADHLEWCKKRAREYLDRGDAPQALASILSDIGKHSETADLLRNPAILALAGFAQQNCNVEEVRRFVDGF